MSRIPFRAEHYLTANTRTTAPSSVLCVAIEPKITEHPEHPGQWINELGQWRAVYGRYGRKSWRAPTLLAGETIPSFWVAVWGLLQFRRPLYVFSPNVSLTATLLGLWAGIDNGNLKLADDTWPIKNLVGSDGDGRRPWRGTLVTEDPPTILKFRWKGCTVCWCDLRNYWPCSLEQLREAVASRAGDYVLDTDLAKLPGAQAACDAETTWDAMHGLIDYWRGEDMGSWRSTAAGLAWNAFRHRYMDKESILIHGNADAIKLERQSYYGGQCTAFYVGAVVSEDKWVKACERQNAVITSAEIGPIYHLDLTSAYAYAMFAEQFPVKLAQYQEEGALATLENLPVSYGAVAEVRLRSPTETYPVRKDGKLSWAVGTYWTTLAWPELLRAVQHSEILAVGKTAIYELGTPFRRYVSEIWSKRLEAMNDNRPAEVAFWKLLLNCLYGKFAQHAERWLDDSGEAAPCPWGEWHHDRGDGKIPQLYRSVAWHTQRYQPEGEYAHSFPAIAAFVTSYVRIRMAMLRQWCPARSVYYQDSDSLHVSQEGYDALVEGGMVEPKEVGKLKLVERAHSAYYHGPKDYTLDGRHVIAGVPKDARPIDPRTFDAVQSPRLRSILATRPASSLITRRKVIRLESAHVQGTLGDDGWVAPPVLS